MSVHGGLYSNILFRLESLQILAIFSFNTRKAIYIFLCANLYNRADISTMSVSQLRPSSVALQNRGYGNKPFSLQVLSKNIDQVHGIESLKLREAGFSGCRTVKLIAIVK